MKGKWNSLFDGTVQVFTVKTATTLKATEFIANAVYLLYSCF